MKLIRNYIHKLKSRLYFTLWPTRVNISTVNPILKETDLIFIDRNIQLKSILVGIRKDIGNYPYYPKFARFLSNNNISYKFLNINEIHSKYRYKSDNDNLIFEKGDFWLQEIILKRF